MSKMPFQKSLLALMVAGVVSASTSLFAANERVETISSNRDHQSGKIRMLRSTDGAMSIQDKSQRPLSDKVASQFAPRFGLQDPARQLRVKKEKSENNKTTIRYRQQQNGIPVFAGELIANVNAQQQLTSMSGEVSSMAVQNSSPTISSEQARQTALMAVAKWYKIDISQLQSNEPQLSIYDPSLIYDAPPSAQLVWKLNVNPTYQAAINEVFLIDAHAGGVILHFNKVDTALNRRIYDANNIITLPGNLLCNEAPPCSGDPDATNAYDYLEDTFDFYALNHGRDGIDDIGSVIRATVNFPESGGPNAFWIGAEPYLGQTNIMGFTDGMAVDDVVAHEYTHGVTENESGLIYLSESGAINESLSDIWGEFVDLGNSAGNDTAGVKWEIGEDAVPTLGAIRDMSDPTIFSDPDKMTSPNFFVSFLDNGGVHINSGVNNKAAYLMVDGSLAENDPNPGEFNGQTVAAMGLAKTAKLYYEVQTNHLTTGSDYLDLYNALLAACSALVTSGDLDANDCTNTVQPALTAVEMNLPPAVADYAPAAEVCPVGVNVYDLFVDDFELNNLSNWTSRVISGTNIWATDNINLGTNSGNYTLVGRGFAVNITGGTDNDVALETTTPIRVPSSTTAYIHFEQAFYFEVDQINQLTNYDGGVIEYSIDNGANWTDAGGLIDSGRDYGGAVSQFNPQPSRNAFVRFSNGFNSTRLNLSSLAGEFVLFRFRSLADEVTASGPWTIDNFRFYLCADNAPPIPNAGPDQSINGEVPVQLSGSASDLDGDALTYSWTQISGTTVTLAGANTLTPTFTSPRNDTNLVFELSVTDGNTTEVDTVSIGVQFFFSVADGGSSGGDGGGGCSLNEAGRFDPIWLLLLIFFATVHLVTRRAIQLRETGQQEKSNQR